MASLLALESCKKDQAPEVTTHSISTYATTAALAGGTITSDGGASVTLRGVCWSENENPTTADHKTSDGSGTGSFDSQVVDLTPNTTYYVRAYAVNTAGTSYGQQVSFMTYRVLGPDDEGYHSVTIGTQEWLKENLSNTHYSDGSPIPNITDQNAWVAATSGAYCDFDNNESNVALYGRLYNWAAVVDSRGVCPTGWHLPTLGEWDELANSLGGADVAGGAMKAEGTLQAGNGQWNEPNTGATNSSGFTALPGGTRFDGGEFIDLHSYGHWWAVEGDMNYAWATRLQDNTTVLEQHSNYSYIGHSVRCVRD